MRLCILAIVGFLISAPTAVPQTSVSLIFSPGSLAFPPQVVNPSAPAGVPQTVTLKNSGSASVTITSIVSTADYSQSNNCPAALAVNATCTIQVTFLPNSIGTINGALTVSSGAASSPQIVGLSGIGVTPIGFSSSYLDFGTVSVGASSIPHTVTIKNQQGTNLGITSISTSGDYSQTNDCPSSLSPAQTCNITITFFPTNSYYVGGSVTVVTDGALGTQSLWLAGTGSGTSTSQVGISPVLPLISFDQVAGTTGPGQTYTLSNLSMTTSLSIASVTPSSGNYQESDTCNSQVPPGGSCTITMTFQPTADFAPLDDPGAITIIGSDPDSPNVIFWPGRAVAPLTSSPDPLSLFTVFPGQSFGQIASVNNNQATAVDVSLSVSPPFVLNSMCGASISAGGFCDVEVSIKNDGSFIGPANGALVIGASSNGFLSPRVASVSACLPDVIVSPLVLLFEEVAVGASSEPQTVTFYSPNGIANLSNPSLSNATNFTIVNDTCVQVATQLCTLQITYTPQCCARVPNQDGTVSFSDDRACSPQSAQLLGSRAGPYVLTVSQFTSGGTVTSNPAGLNCSFAVGNPFCSGSFAEGAMVTLNATADSSHAFNGWSGACTGSGSCVLNMNADKQVVATFVTPDFSMVTSPLSPATVTAGTPAMSTITVTSSGQFSSAVHFTCSVNPSPALAPTCSLSPASVNPISNGSATSLLTINTTAAVTALETPADRRPPIFCAISLPIAGLAWFELAMSIRRKRSRRALQLLLVALFLGLSALQSGCGGSTQVVTHTNGTPAGIYTVTVTGSAGSLLHSTTVNLTVQ